MKIGRDDISTYLDMRIYKDNPLILADLRDGHRHKLFGGRKEFGMPNVLGMKQFWSPNDNPLSLTDPLLITDYHEKPSIRLPLSGTKKPPDCAGG